jgi:hypothetical protein
MKPAWATLFVQRITKADLEREFEIERLLARQAFRLDRYRSRPFGLVVGLLGLTMLLGMLGPDTLAIFFIIPTVIALGICNGESTRELALKEKARQLGFRRAFVRIG